MSVLYCLNPECEQPKNEMRYRVCQSCGTSLLLRKRYVAIKKIGKGGFAVTFLAVDLGNNKSYCVIKQLLTNNHDEDTSRMALDLFEREAKTLARINHPQIPKLLNYFQEKKQFYLIQEFILGQDLEKEIQKKGLFQETTAKRFLKEMLPVLDYIHSQKVIHRDIKPGNILRQKQDERLILIDFGAVKDQVNTQLMKSNPQTAYTQISIGTMGFAPPEQLAMRPVYASDIYALAATCIYLLTGKIPKDLSDEISGRLEWEKYTTVSSNFAKILNKMLDLDVRKRYNSAQEVIQALDILPYEQELAGGMIRMKTSIDSDDIFSSLNDTDTPKRNRITSPDLAEAIRKRQERNKKLSLQSENLSSENKVTTTKLTSEKIIQQYSKGNKNFSQMNFSQMNLESLKLSRASFSQGKLIGTNLQKSNLYKTNFYNANLAQANLKEACLKKAELFRANLKSADLQGANLKGANLTGANLKDANLCGANLTGAEVDDRQLKEAKTNWQTIYPNGRRRFW
jgi:serine/threonine-protein kinase